MEVGYARTSTLEQKAGLDAQLRDLKAAGVKKIFSEQLSSVDAERPQLESALDFARESLGRTTSTPVEQGLMT